MKDAQPPPFFIVGSPRSGTTLLRFMLSSHPRICVPDETGFIPFLRVPAEILLTREQVHGVLDRIGRLNRDWREMEGERDRFYESLPEPTMSAVLDRLYRIRIRRHGAVRWGDKTPLYVRYIPLLHRLFPRAQFIHVIRDGRDATLSALEKWGGKKGYLDSYYLLVNWTRNVHAGRTARPLLGGQGYMEVRYEELVANPEAALRRTCSFLKEDFDPQMLDQVPAARTAGGGIDLHVEPQRPVTTSHVGRWVTEMSDFDKKLSDRVAGRTLTALGYPLAGLGPISASERLRLAYLAGRFLVVDRMRTALYGMGLLTLNRNRRS